MPTHLMRAAAVVVILAVTACIADTDPRVSGTPSQPPTRCDPELDAALSDWAAAGFSGSIVMTADGEAICEAAYGLADEATTTPNTPDTVFSIGSVTKAFTAAAIFDLIDNGILAPGDHVGDILPALHGPVADATVMQLMVHTSGLSGSHGGDHEPLERAAALEAIDGLEQAFEPGTDYLYSNAGYTLLALVIEELSGMRYREHAMTRILSGYSSAGFWDGEPAARGPRAVGYRDDGTLGEPGDFAGPHWAADGNGSLAMTMSDLAAWTRALFTGQVVSPESTEVVASPQVELGEGRSETPGWVAFDKTVHGEPFLATAGGGGDVGHDVVVMWIPDEKRVVAAASNGPGISAEELLAAVGPALAAGEPLPAPDVPGNDTDPSQAAAIVGSYRLDTGGSYDVTSGNDGLQVAAHGSDAVGALFPPRDKAEADAVETHENLVTELLAGETAEGRAEVGALEETLGDITGVELGGTIVAEGELRTFVTITTGGGPIVAWYALDDEGGVAGAEVDAEPPALTLVPDGAGYRPFDPAGTGPDVSLSFADTGLTISGPHGSSAAFRVD